MGQQANNAGRRATLDEQKQRSAGRTGRTGQDHPARRAMRDDDPSPRVKGKAGGAFGPAPGTVRASTPVKANSLTTGRSKKPARSRQ